MLTALLLVLAAVLLADFSLGFVRLDHKIEACDSVNVLWALDSFGPSASKHKQWVVRRDTEPERFAALQEIVAGYGYRRKWNQSNAVNAHALPSASITLRFGDEQKDEAACVYAVYDDGMVVIDSSVVKPGWFYAKRAQGLYASMETLLFPEGTPIS